MGLGFQRTTFGVLEQFGEAHGSIKVGLEHLGVDEETDQRLGFDTVAVGNRHADTDIALPAVAVQKQLERCQQQHEQGHAFALGQGLQTGHQPRVKLDVLTGTEKALLRRARTIEGQRQHRLCTAQQLTPIVQLARFLARLHPAALPQRIVAVLDRQRRQGAVLTLAVRGVQLHQFLHHHAHRPTIGHNMVLHQHQHMLLCIEFQQGYPQQRALAQIERTGDLGLDPGLELRLVGTVFKDLDVGMG